MMNSRVAAAVAPFLVTGRTMRTKMATLLFIITSGEFLYSVSFLSDPGKYTLSATLALQVTQYGIDWPALMAASVMASIPAIGVFLLGQRSLVRGLSAGTGK